jgi:hypothetical protein
MSTTPDYGLMSVDPDAYPRSIRFTLDVLENGDLIFESLLDPTRMDMAEGDRYVVVIVDGTVVLKKSEGKCCNCS